MFPEARKAAARKEALEQGMLEAFRFCHGFCGRFGVFFLSKSKDLLWVVLLFTFFSSSFRERLSDRYCWKDLKPRTSSASSGSGGALEADLFLDIF